jgi:hypothetical protein
VGQLDDGQPEIVDALNDFEKPIEIDGLADITVGVEPIAP